MRATPSARLSSAEHERSPRPCGSEIWQRDKEHRSARYERRAVSGRDSNILVWNQERVASGRRPLNWRRTSSASLMALRCRYAQHEYEPVHKPVFRPRSEELLPVEREVCTRSEKPQYRCSQLLRCRKSVGSSSARVLAGSHARYRALACSATESQRCQVSSAFSTASLQRILLQDADG